MFKVREIVKLVQKCNIINTHVIKKTKETNLPTADFILDFYVRWNTTYLMLERFHLLKVIVDEITCNPQIIVGIQKSHLDKIRKINFKQDDWECISVLINVLKPFYKATVMLQGQKYHSLSISKVIESSFIKYYDQLFKNSNNFLESMVSSKLSEYVKKYLVEKISVPQKELTSVNYLLNDFVRNVLF